MFNPYEAQQQELDRRRQMAQFLVGQQFQQQPRENALTALARVLGAKFAGQSLQGVKSDQEALNTERKTSAETQRKAISEALMGKPGVTPFSAETPYPAIQQDPVAPDRNKALALMLGGQDDGMRNVAMAQALKPEEGFTLGPGQIRFDAQNRQIAQGLTDPQKREAPTVREFKEGNKVVTKQWNPSTGEWDALATGEEPDPKAFENANKLRDEFNAATKDYVKVRDAYGRIVASAKDPSAAGDLALIFNYMKVLDPGSTVREGEFATAQNSAGVGTQVMNIYNRVLSGERLAPEQRQDFFVRAGKLHEAQLKGLDQLEGQYRSLSERLSVDPANVVTDYRVDYGQGDMQMPQTDAHPVPQTQEEYDALPAGTVFKDPDDGKLYTKPQRDATGGGGGY